MISLLDQDNYANELNDILNTSNIVHQELHYITVRFESRFTTVYRTPVLALHRKPQVTTGGTQVTTGEAI